MDLNRLNDTETMTSPLCGSFIRWIRVAQQRLIVTALAAAAMASSCASWSSVPPVPFSEIQRIRREFLGGRTVGLSYDPSAWDGMVEGHGVGGRRAFGLNSDSKKYEMAFYVKLKNQSDAALRVSPAHFGLATVNGQTFSPGSATAATSRPFPTTELSPQAWTEGYIVFELSLDALSQDQVSLLRYDDGVANRAARYLSLADMVQYEGLGSRLSEKTAAGPVPQSEVALERRSLPGRWESRWIPGRREGGVQYRGYYETFWIEERRQ